MATEPDFDFGKGSVAQSYDDVLVPLIFRPWGERLLDEHGPWVGRTVLDLATGTGVVARLLADRVGSDGQVIAADINPQMLHIASDHCAGSGERVRFVESSAHPLEIDSDTVDAVICQQGFQLFPERGQSAVEILRVLRDEGVALVSTWCSVALRSLSKARHARVERTNWVSPTQYARLCMDCRARSSSCCHPKLVSLFNESGKLVPTSHRWGHNHSPASAGLLLSPSPAGRFYLCSRGCRNCEHGSRKCLRTQQCKMSTDAAGVLAHGGAIGRSRNCEADRGADCGYGFSKTSGPYRLGVMARTQREQACASAERRRQCFCGMRGRRRRNARASSFPRSDCRSRTPESRNRP